MFNEVARILAEEGVDQTPRPLDLSVCGLMSFDHWAPEDIFGPSPVMVVADLDDHEVSTQLAGLADLEDVA